jgi:FkbM family methyltransferase
MKSMLLSKLIQLKVPGSGRLSRILNKFGLMYFKTVEGVNLLLDSYDYIDYKIICEGYFDRAVFNVLNENIRANDSFWDIGSHFGLHSLTLKKCHPSLKVHCFEPSNQNFGRLLLNAKINSFENFNLFQVGVGSMSKVAGFSQSTINSGMSGFKGDNTADYFSIVTYVDELIDKGLTPPTIIKIDVEGLEYEVFQGMRNTLETIKPRVIVYETYNFQKEIETYLKGFGYQINQIDGQNDFVAKLSIKTN